MYWLVPLWLVVVFGSSSCSAIGLPLSKWSKAKSKREMTGQFFCVSGALLGGLVVFGCLFMMGDSGGEKASNPVMWLNLLGFGLGMAGIVVCGLKEDRSV